MLACASELFALGITHRVCDAMVGAAFLSANMALELCLEVSLGHLQSLLNGFLLFFLRAIGAEGANNVGQVGHGLCSLCCGIVEALQGLLY